MGIQLLPEKDQHLYYRQIRMNLMIWNIVLISDDTRDLANQDLDIFGINRNTLG